MRAAAQPNMFNDESPEERRLRLLVSWTAILRVMHLPAMLLHLPAMLSVFL
jgi:hypothetical protein